MVSFAPLGGGNVATRRVRCCGAWPRLAVAVLVACGGAADDGDRVEQPATHPPPPPVVEIEPRAAAVAAPDTPAAVPDAEEEAEASGAPSDAIEWSSLPPPGSYETPFPFPANATPEQQRQWLRARAETVLSAYCAECHGPRDVFAVQGGFGDITDFDAIVEQGQLIPCDARNSPVLLRMLDRSMPPPGTSSVRASDIAVVRDATDFACVSE